VKVLAEVFWYFVTEGNRVAARRGGEQPEVNSQSATRVNSIRPVVVASLPGNGEVCQRMRSSSSLENSSHPQIRDVRQNRYNPIDRHGGRADFERRAHVAWEGVVYSPHRALRVFRTVEPPDAVPDDLDARDRHSLRN
jgi:hypothetical protein